MLSTNYINLSAGPAALPQQVLDNIRSNERIGAQGISIFELNHFTDEYKALESQVRAKLRLLLGLDESWKVRLLQGGASLQFTLVPLNFLRSKAAYIDSGFWASKATDCAKALHGGQIHEFKSANENYSTLKEPCINHDYDFVHLTSNNTCYGSQWKTLPCTSSPLVIDATSDLLARPLDLNRASLVYASAQKNLGIAGVTVILIKDNFLEKANSNIDGQYLSYREHFQRDWLFNTPPVFAVYAMNQMLGWIETTGVQNLYEQNLQKATMLYKEIDHSDGFYTGHVEKEIRSQNNMLFHLESSELEEKFIKAAFAKNIIGIRGFFQVGGIRASNYNGISLQDISAFTSFMREFRSDHS